jgi:hypothetical protein
VIKFAFYTRPLSAHITLDQFAARGMSTTTNNTSAPTGATDAVLKPSAPIPEGSREVQGIDFNQYASRNITVEELVGGYANMGFQATSVGEAVRIINDMVSCSRPCARL